MFLSPKAKCHVGMPTDHIRSCIAFRAGAAASEPSLMRTDGSRLSNGDLLEYCHHFEALLANSSLTNISRIAVVVDNGPEAALAVMVVMAHAVAVPISPQLTENEIHSIFRETRIEAILIDAATTGSTLRLLQQLGLPLIFMNTEPTLQVNLFTAMGLDTVSESPACSLQNDLCMILQTSGTTGVPKLVPFTHQRILGIAKAYAQAFALGTNDCCLSPMSLQHTHGIFALYATLLSGGSILCTPNAYPATIMQSLKRFPITWLTAVPTVLQALMYSPCTSPRPLRFIRSSAAHLPTATIRQLEEQFSTQVFETYGLTEISFATISHSGNRRQGSIGTAAEHIEIQILDRERKICPPKTTGEIALRSHLITSEYLGNEKATEEAFYQGWFLTGDEGYIDQDGFVFLTGRLKDIINRAGENISPNEIDEAIMHHPSVVQSATFGVAHPELGERVVSALVLRDQAKLTETEIKAFVSHSLASYKIPSQILFVEKIPCGKTGKIQRRLLSEHFSQEIALGCQKEFIAPASADEICVAATWSRILNKDAISRKDDFFHLGGNSLQAAAICAELSQHFHVSLTPHILLAYSTVQEFTEAVLTLAHKDRAVGGEIVANDRVIVLNGHFPGTPLIFFHQDFDFGGVYTRRLGNGLQRPLIVIDPVLPEDIMATGAIEVFAEYYAALIKQYRPQGPYILGGFCAGGTVAYEIARLFAQQSDQVELLILMNTIAKNARFSWLDYCTSFVSWKSVQQRNAWFLRFRRALTGSHGVNAIHWEAPLQILLQRFMKKFAQVSNTKGDAPPAAQADWMAYHFANAAFCPKKSPVRTLLFTCDEAPPDRYYGWEHYTQLVRTEYYAGVQDDLISIHADQVARTIESTISTFRQL